MIEKLRETLEGNKAVVCVIGTGYVGLPLVLGFAESGLKTIGFDVNKEKITQLKNGKDSTEEVENIKLEDYIERYDITFTSDLKSIKEADFVILCIPTPIGKNKEPDLSFVENAGKIVGREIKKGCVVVLESTVYPGVTEDILKPIIERESGMICERDFYLGYSPERVNPGDVEHSLKGVVKVVSGVNQETTDILESLYKRVVKAGILKAKNIKTAEAAKVIENIQRDLNIALANELSIIFGRMGIDIRDVLQLAETKWNFHVYHPGLVGGHCIPVDPYYLVFRSKKLGYNPKVILAGREINDSMPIYVANKMVEELEKSGRNPKKSQVLLLGLTFKKNVRDTRNTPVKGIIEVFKERGIRILSYEPLIEKKCIEKEFGIESIKNLEKLNDIDGIITVTDHDFFVKHVTIEDLKGVSSPGAIIFDIRRMFERDKVLEAGFKYVGL